MHKLFQLFIKKYQKIIYILNLSNKFCYFLIVVRKIKNKTYKSLKLCCKFKKFHFKLFIVIDLNILINARNLKD